MKSAAILNLQLAKQGSDFQVIPSGKFRAVDGRPVECDSWEVTNPSALLKKIQNRKKPIIIDYEHQTLLSAQNGQPAPKAGQVLPNNFEWRDSGLWAINPQWNEKAKEYLKNNEYSEISPVIYFNQETGEVTGLHSIALTNDPALHDLASVSLTRLINLEEVDMTETTDKLSLFSDNEPDDRIQKVLILEQILEMLGLPMDAADDVILKTLTDVLSDKKRLETAFADVLQPQGSLPEMSGDMTQVAANNLAMSSLTQKVEILTKQLEKREAELKSRDIEDLIKENLTKLPTKDAQDKARAMPIETLKQVLTMIPEQIALNSMQTQGKNFDKKEEKTSLEKAIERNYLQGAK